MINAKMIYEKMINAKMTNAKMINAKMTNAKMLYEKTSCAILHPGAGVNLSSLSGSGVGQNSKKSNNLPQKLDIGSKAGLLWHKEC